MSPLVNGQRTKYNIFYAAKIGNISKNIAFIIQQKIRPSFEGRIIIFSYFLFLFFFTIMITTAITTAAITR